MDYRKSIHDKIITDFKALNFDSTSTKCFVDVKKLFVTEPESLPVCRIIGTGTSVIVDGNTHDTRIFNFTADTFEYIDMLLQSEAELKIDRLSNIEDSILSYLEKLPNNLENDISGIHIYDILIEQTSYQYQTSDRGLEVAMSIPFGIKVSITPQLL